MSLGVLFVFQGTRGFRLFFFLYIFRLSGIDSGSRGHEERFCYMFHKHFSSLYPFRFFCVLLYRSCKFLRSQTRPCFYFLFSILVMVRRHFLHFFYSLAFHLGRGESCAGMSGEACWGRHEVGERRWAGWRAGLDEPGGIRGGGRVQSRSSG